MMQRLLSWLRKNGQLIIALTARDITSRFRGSIAGLAWIVLTPLLLLGIYHFVFTAIFKARWAMQTTGEVPFALALYTGLVVFTTFSEPFSRAPSLITTHANLVKRIVFPLEVLPLMAACSGAAIACLQATLLMLALFVWKQALPWTAILLPAVILPVFLLAFGTTALVSALGVYLKDLSHLAGLFLTATMFLSPVFYPIEAVPESLLWMYHLNPLTTSIEHARAVLLDGVVPPLAAYLRGFATGLIAAVIGAGFFAWLKPGFADVL